VNVQLGDVCHFLNGGTPSKSIPSYFEGDVPWITGADISEPVVRFARSFITEEAISKSATNRVPAGTILLVTRTSVGKAAISGMELCFSQDITALKPDPHKLDTAYLLQFLRIQGSHFDQQARGATIKGITRDVIERLEIPLPPIAQQKRIAAILDKAEELRGLRRQALEALDAIAQSIFLEMFGDPVTNPKGWQTSHLRKVCDEINDCPHSTPTWTEHGVVCLRTSNLTEGSWHWEDTRFVSMETYHERSKRGYILAGDIILSREGTVGVAAIVTLEMKVCMGQRLVQLRPSASILTSEFTLQHLLYVLAPTRLSRLMVGSTSQHLNVKELKDLRIPLPPLPLQQEFTRRVEAIEQLKTTHRESLTQLNALFASLQHRAFRGEL